MQYPLFSNCMLKCHPVHIVHHIQDAIKYRTVILAKYNDALLIYISYLE